MNFSIPHYPDFHTGSIYCIGRNYAKHIEEMKSETTEAPVVFIKPRSSIIFNGDSIVIPQISKNVHHEVELVILIGKETRFAPPEEALNSVKAIAVGLDITARDIQTEAKKAGLPWALAKGFDTFAPIGNFVDYNAETDLKNLDIEVSVNDEIRQAGNTSNMLFPVDHLISYLSEQFTLHPGDLIFTGTPEGVSQIHPGDVIKASIGRDISKLNVYVTA